MRVIGSADSILAGIDDPNPSINCRAIQKTFNVNLHLRNRHCRPRSGISCHYQGKEIPHQALDDAFFDCLSMAEIIIR